MAKELKQTLLVFDWSLLKIQEITNILEDIDKDKL